LATEFNNHSLFGICYPQLDTAKPFIFSKGNKANFMNTLGKTITTFALTGMLMAMLSGCTKPEGPAEKAGDQLQDKSIGATP